MDRYSAIRESSERLADGAGEEQLWLEVVRKMDEVYQDLLRYEVELEMKNTELEALRQFFASAQIPRLDF